MTPLNRLLMWKKLQYILLHKFVWQFMQRKIKFGQKTEQFASNFNAQCFYHELYEAHETARPAEDRKQWRAIVGRSSEAAPLRSPRLWDMWDVRVEWDCIRQSHLLQITARHKSILARAQNHVSELLAHDSARTYTKNDLVF